MTNKKKSGKVARQSEELAPPRVKGTLYAYWPFPVIGKLTAADKAMLGPTRAELLKQKREQAVPDALL